MKPRYILLSALLSTGLFSCSKFLDRPPLDEYSDATYWTTEQDAVRFASRIYEFMPSADFFICYEGMSDNALSKTASWGNTLRNAQLIGNSTFVATTGNLGDEWRYDQIRHCLEFLANVDKVPDINQDLKKRLIAEVKVCLAYRYYMMTTLFGDVPLVTKVFSTPAASDVPQDKKAVVLAQVLQWLDEAAPDLPATYSGDDKGRFTTGAATALKARVLLYNGDNAGAAKAAQVVMSSGTYSLYPDYYYLFQQEGDYSSESIMSYIHVKEIKANGLRDITGVNSVSGGTLYLNPLPSLVDDYESAAGYYPYTNDPAYDVHAPWKGRDPRLAATVYYPGSTLANGKMYDPLNNNLDKIGGDKATYSGYAFKKMFDKTELEVRDNGGNDWHILRYAEVLLTFAEAENEVAGPTAAVVDAIDQIRRRAGMPTVAATFALNGWALDQATMRTFIRHERRIELAGEGHRYFDILRWKEGKTLLNGPVYTLDASAGLSDIPGNNKFTKTKLEDRYFNNDKFYVWPVPQSILDGSRQLQQQSAWK
ncbi:RagB/SusD family nutrient uptake outer membrane protein [Chitinophaga sp. sic0106]|uniref:RagB/SusD family nutrient uptake outer membrane protein n=1 Tax=Chitinophaga sp. sic0106 TaxID=2854785 RepID=UPI001C45553C|nr:RagB/SusD family nutrient uptake outer membrane protein [Chitinophaga sp. sic0106]MBV7530171.1 RagB/SusD family nutrient uptake outer membrane protein [Chitinophaga sp. sic0106]